jgi:DHA1 family multidrug/chloramphenicol efflux transport protein-like MFS transporter
MLVGALFFFLCTVLIACTHSIDQFLVARVFQGMGLCFISVIGYSTLQEIFAEMDAIRLISIMANVSILAPLIGPLLGAIFIYYYSWRLIFVVIGVLALIALWGLWRFMPEPVGQIKRDGEEIKRVSFSPHVIASNYKKLLLNRPFMLGSIGLGVIYLPCLAWIGLSPVMLVKSAHLSMIQYGLWQLPVFGAYILGNAYLHQMTRSGTVKQLILTGSGIAAISMLLIYILPLFINHDFLWLMPGLIAYFFGAGIIGAPLSRFILFSTDVGKGTASALMGMISMCIQAFGLELANVIYSGHNNNYFGLFCALVAITYLAILSCCLWKSKAPEALAS